MSLSPSRPDPSHELSPSPTPAAFPAPFLEVRCAGGMRVDATLKGRHEIVTDQPVKVGGGGTAPAPFDFFLASLATCGGFYAAQFCEQRGIDSREVRLTLEPVRNPDSHRLETLRIDLHLPEDFPAKYRKAILRAVDQCSVKKVLLDPPEIVTEIAAR